MLVEFLQIVVLQLGFTTYCALIGFAGLRVLFGRLPEAPLAPNSLLTWFFAISLGLVLSALLLSLLAALGLFRMEVILAAFAILALPSIASVKRLIQHRLTFPDPVLIFVLASGFVLPIIHAMQAPGYWDDTMYHLPLARSYIETGGLHLNEFLRFPLFPQNMNLIMALGLIVGDEFGAQALSNMPIFVLLIGLLGMSQWQTGGVLTGALAFVFLVAMAPVRFTLGYSYVDIGLAAMAWAAVLGVALSSLSASKQERDGWIVYAGLICAGAVGTKFFGVAFAAEVFLAIALEHRSVRPLLIFALTVLAFGSFWYLRSFLLSGDPIHPAGGNLFGFFLWNEGDLASQTREQQSFGVPVLSFNLPKALIEVGAVLMVPALVSLMFPGPTRGFRVLWFCFFAYLILWFAVTQVDRYLAPVFGAGVFLSAFVLIRSINWVVMRGGLERWLSKTGSAFGRHISSVLIVGIFIYLPVEQLLKSHSTREAWDKALSERIGYDLMQEANRASDEDGRLLQIGFENAVYFFDGTVIGDHFGPGRYRDTLDCSTRGCLIPPPERMRQRLEVFDADLVMIASRYLQPDLEAQYEASFTVIARDNHGALLRPR